MSAGTTTGLLLVAAALCWPARPAHRAMEALRVGRRETQRRLGAGPGPAWLHPWRARWAGMGLRLPVPSRARDREDVAVVDVLDALAAALNTGLPAAEALGVVAAQSAHQPWLARAEQAARAGQSIAAALHRTARHTRQEDLAIGARAWELSERTGAPLADGLRAAARAGRARRDQAHRVAAATAGARATMTVLTLLPVGGLGLAVVLGLGPAQVYGNPAGLASAALGVPLVLAGRAVVRRLVARVEAVA